MKIVLAGQLDRVYSNALAGRTIEPGRGWSEDTDDAQFEKDRPLIHRAATLAALSETVLTAPDWYPVKDEDGQRSAQPLRESHFAPGMLLTEEAWANLFDDAAELVQAVDF